jgi:hypothetical protein
MPRTERPNKVVRSQRLAVLQAWVGTSACWTAASVAWPVSTQVLWIGLAIGCVLSFCGLVVSHRTRWVSMNNLPTLLGLLAVAAMTQVCAAAGGTYTEPINDLHTKALITLILVAAFVVEQVAPYGLRRLRRFLGEVVREEMDRKCD